MASLALASVMHCPKMASGTTITSGCSGTAFWKLSAAKKNILVFCSSEKRLTASLTARRNDEPPPPRPAPPQPPTGTFPTTEKVLKISEHSHSQPDTPQSSAHSGPSEHDFSV